MKSKAHKAAVKRLKERALFREYFIKMPIMRVKEDKAREQIGFIPVERLPFSIAIETGEIGYDCHKRVRYVAA